MTDHVPQSAMLDYANSRLSGSEVLAVDDHLASCTQCRSAAAAAVLNPNPRRNTLKPFFITANDVHMQFSELSQYVEGGLDAIQVEIAREHLRDCSDCRAEADSIRSLLAKGPSALSTQPSLIGVSRVQRLFSIRTLRFALPIAAVATLIGIGFWFARIPTPQVPTSEAWPQPTLENAVVDNEPIEPPPNQLAQIPADVPEPAAVTISDAGRSLEIGRDGKVIGSFAGQYDSRIAAALTTGSLAIAPAASALRPSAGVLMGPGAPSSSLRPQYPVGKIISSRRPEMRWTPVKGATEYTVEIFDTDFNKVATSPSLSRTSWQAPALAAGREYSWQVTAVTPDATIKAPTRPAPDAKFAVLSESKLNEIAAAGRAYGNSHLVLGMVYADAGLLDEAEREFTALLRKNPDSAAVKRLLARIRAPK